MESGKSPARRRRYERPNVSEMRTKKREGLEFPVMIIYKFVRMVVNAL
jgi:hypothetical protein